MTFIVTASAADDALAIGGVSSTIVVGVDDTTVALTPPNDTTVAFAVAPKP